MRNLLYFAIIILLAAGLEDAGAKRAMAGIRTATQPDGSTIEYIVTGDEYLHFTVTPTGDLLTLDPDGFYRLAEIDAQGGLVSTGLLPSKENIKMRALNLKDINPEAVASKRKNMRRAPVQSGVGLFPSTFPISGSPKALVILVEYDDVKFNTSYDGKEYFNEMINGENFTMLGGTGSALQYFRDQSGGKFTPSFDILGPVTLPRARVYYGQNNRWGEDANAHLMVTHAIEILDSEVDFSQYDTDGDGIIDNVYVFYAGQGEADYGDANTVWPHSWDIRELGMSMNVDGVEVGHYACSNEWGMDLPDGIGTFVHEFSHVLGLPDLYNTVSAAAMYTPYDYSVLDYGPYHNNSRTPPNYGAYEKNALGWYQPIVIEEPVSLELNEIASGEFALIPTDKDTEFFLLENRQQVGWDTFIPGHGLLIWHIDYDEDIFLNNTVNNSKNHQRVDIIEANNNPDPDFADGYPFPGTTGKTSFTSSTNPALKAWSGKGIDYPITDIEEEDGVISFNVSGGGTFLRAPIPEITRYSEKKMYFEAEWKPVKGATDYYISVYALEDPSEANGELLPEYDNVSTNGETKYKVDRLIEGVSDYYFTVTATDGNLEKTSEPVFVTVIGEQVPTSVESIGEENLQPEYYSLQGLRITNLKPGDIVIERRGTKSRKILVK